MKALLFLVFVGPMTLGTVARAEARYSNESGHVYEPDADPDPNPSPSPSPSPDELKSNLEDARRAAEEAGKAYQSDADQPYSKAQAVDDANAKVHEIQGKMEKAEAAAKARMAGKADGLLKSGNAADEIEKVIFVSGKDRERLAGLFNSEGKLDREAWKSFPQDKANHLKSALSLVEISLDAKEVHLMPTGKAANGDISFLITNPTKGNGFLYIEGTMLVKPDGTISYRPPK